MFSTTIKRSVATLGVVAGLLAAAGPASAQILDGPVLAKAGPQVGSECVKAPVPASLVDWGPGVCYFHTGKAATNAGTQVGSEGVKAPTRADDQAKVSGYTYNPKEIGID